MTGPSPPVKASKRNLAGKFIHSVYDRARDVISRPSSAHSFVPSQANDIPGSSTLPGPNIDPTFSTDCSAVTGSDIDSKSISSASPKSIVRSRDSFPGSGKSFKDVSNVALNGLTTVLRVLEKSADTFPPLKSAVGCLLACLDVVEAAAGNSADYEELSTELKTMANTLNKHVSNLAVSEDGGGSVACILQSIEAESTHIKQKQDHGKARRMIESPQDKEDVLKRYRRIESLFRQLHNDVSLRTWDNTRKLREASLLQAMPSVDDAIYNSGYSITIKRRACTAETREKIQRELEDWVADPNGAKVCWINGMAGTGKTTIMYSLCKWLEENQRLGGNFFCSRISASCRSANNILPTLATQLAQYSSAFRTALCKVLDNEPGAGKRDVSHQFKKLILQPMKEVKDAMPEGVVVVVDALDECDDSSVVRMFLGLMPDHAESLPIKFIVTSRPEPAIRNKMQSPGFKPSILHLHDIEESIVEADIKKYLSEELRGMTPQPLPDQMERLAKRAGKLFIYAATAVRYIYPDGRSVDSRRRLETVLKTDHSTNSSKQHRELDFLYTSILCAAFNDDIEDWEMNDIRLVLQTAICAKEPMPVKTLAVILGLEEDRVRVSLEPLRSVLHMQEDSGLVSALHASFPDYIFDSRRSTPRFCCDRTQHSQIIANGCFDVMKSQLRFNICNLESSFVFDKDIADLNERIKTHISRELSYACRYWGEHLREGNFTDALHEKLIDFLTRRLLFWMEVLNLEDQMVLGGNMLWKIQNWLESSLIDTRAQVADAEAFVTRYTAGACTRSTPHIYISGLPFCPTSSSVYKNFLGRTRGLIKMKRSTAELWSTSTIATWMNNSLVFSVAFSPDGTRIVSGSEDEKIRVRDARTGHVVLGPLEGHTSWIASVAFSPDSARIVSGSYDSTIRVWDACTGDVVAGPFEGHTRTVTSVAYSPDMALIVSGSKDNTIRVWDALTGHVVVGPLEGHTYPVQSVAFSPDGARIVSGSNDNTIRVWDARTGDPVIGPLEGHTFPVYSVAFSPDGTRIVSGSSDRTLRVWDAYTGHIVIGPLEEHTGVVSSVSYSPDGARIVSGSHDTTIRVWDAHTGIVLAGPLEGHTSLICSVAFSPDGTRIVSGSGDKTIRVWDARTGTVVEGQLERHTSTVRSVAFSPDGTHIVSGSKDNTVRIWDARTGHLVVGPLEEHTDEVTSVSYAPDGCRIVSGSQDKTIRVWDARTGDVVVGPLEGHTDAVHCVAFSPDGVRIVSGSYDNTIRVWDALTGDMVAGPFEGHTSWVRSVAYSPDGSCIVSGSGDDIRVCDARTGTIVTGPLEGHTSLVCSVAFSPDGTRIVSGSGDNTIRVWDACTGEIVAGPLEGHTNAVTSVAYSPDGARIVSGSDDNTIRVWDARTGKIVTGPLEGHTYPVFSVAFSPDGACIVSGSSDHTIRAWDVRIGDTVAGTPEVFTNISLDASGFPLRPHSTPSYVEEFIFNADGWLTAEGVPIFWVAPHFHVQMPQPRNTFVIGPQGTVSVDYHNLHLGDTWSQCFY